LLQVTSDGKGLGASWHLQQVEVTDTIRGVCPSPTLTALAPCTNCACVHAPLPLMHETPVPSLLGGELCCLLGLHCWGAKH